ncbi:hypothetical protein FQN52_007712 [Onygenales sp. PD_12]|nr:hypothetical protein FQN51_003980 [Onygenales sp. PD_10]KAK2786704.1 hypothetical protein FQN52_007712 [Onygenales sp. PD_12]
MASQQQCSQNSSAPAHQASLQPYQPNGANPQAPASFTSTTHTSQPAAASKQHDASFAHQPTLQHPSHNNGCGQGTAAFLRDFNLVAEAAKRAQIAVIARDLEGVSL